VPIKAILLALLVIAIWGANIVAIRAGVLELEPLTFLALRFSLTALAFLPFVKWPGWKMASIIAQVGILMGVLHQGFLYAGLPLLDAGTMSILLQIQVIFVTLIGWLFLGETIRWRTWTGIGLGLAGVVVLLGGPTLEGDLTGFIFGLLSAVFIALCYVRMKALQGVHPLTFIAGMNVSAALPMLVISYAAAPDSWHTLPAHDWGLLAPILAVQVVVLSSTHIIWQKLLADNPVSLVVPWTLLMPVFGVGFAALFLGDPITLPIILGGVLTIAGVGIITIRRIQKGVPPAPEPLE
jgi:O-acetylserine/cysteine efflux transporter